MKRAGFWATLRKEIAREQRQQALKVAGGTIYYIRSGENGPVKIGWTGGTVEKRLRALQTANSEQLRIVGVFPGKTQAQERQLHAQLDRFRIQGEWFIPQVLDALDRTETWRPTECAHPRDEPDPEVLAEPDPEVLAYPSASDRRPHFDTQQEPLKVACPACCAQPGEPCRTVKWPGHRVRRAHTDRAHEARLGWLEVHGRPENKEWARQRRL